VDQSREWPYRDTAPRQDPAESRLDPIWGSDPPDAVRWHMDMTPDQELPASRPDERTDARHEDAADPDPGATLDLAASPPSSSGDPEAVSASTADQPARATPPGFPGHGTGHPARSGTEARGPGQPARGGTKEPGDAGRPPGSTGEPRQHGQPSGMPVAGEGAVSSVAASAGDPGSAVGWFSATADPARFTETLSGRLSAERPVEAPPHDHGKDEQAVPQEPRDMLGAQPTVPLPAGPSEPARPGVEGPGSVERPPETGPSLRSADSTDVEGGTGPDRLASGRETSARRPPDARGSAGPVGSGTYEAPANSESSAGSPGPVGSGGVGSAGITRPGEVAGAERAGVVGSDQVAGAERAGVVGSGEAVGLGGLASSGSLAGGEGATGILGPVHGEAATYPEQPGEGDPVEPAAAPDAGAARPASTGDPALRGPELIEAGMVYVDPDPEIGSPSVAAGWGDRPATPSDSTTRPGGGQQEDKLGRPYRGASGYPGQQRADASEAGSDATAARDPAAESAATAAASGPEDEGVPDSWTEPALPMGLAAGPPRSDRGRRGSRDEDTSDDDLVPIPDPSWPRLFAGGQEVRSSSGEQQAEGTAEPGGGSGSAPALGPEAGLPERERRSLEHADSPPEAGRRGSSDRGGHTAAHGSERAPDSSAEIDRAPSVGVPSGTSSEQPADASERAGTPATGAAAGNAGGSDVRGNHTGGTEAGGIDVATSDATTDTARIDTDAIAATTDAAGIDATTIDAPTASARMDAGAIDAAGTEEASSDAATNGVAGTSGGSVAEARTGGAGTDAARTDAARVAEARTGAPKTDAGFPKGAGIEATGPAIEEASGHGQDGEAAPSATDGGLGTTSSRSESEPLPGDRPGVVDITAGPEGIARQAEGRQGTVQSDSARPGMRSTTAEGGARITEQANISTVARIADVGEVDLRESPAGPPSGDVSRETSAGGGEEMDGSHDEGALEDEAALAVRDAVSRAAAEAGVDVSRETELTDSGSAFDELADAEPSVDSEAAARNARVTFRVHRDSLNGTRRVVAVANQKGGVGKSTTAVNIGAYLALAGARVLVVDLDPQGNASTGLGLDHREIEPSIYDVLTGDASPTAAIRATGVANLHVLPSTIDLAGAEVELVSAMSRETRLRRALESIDHQYDTILIDCPPSLGLLTVNALAAADELLIPIQCEYYALEGLGQLLRNVELVRANLNPDLRIGGIVLTMYDGRTRLALQVVDEVRKHFTDVVYQTVVPRSVRLSEAPGYGLPIALYDPLSRGGIAYRDLTFELAERSGLLAPTGEGAS
jgi:chromosome partitioning protein